MHQDSDKMIQDHRKQNCQALFWSIPGETHEHYRPHKWLAQIRTQGDRKNLPIFLVIAETSLRFFFFIRKKPAYMIQQIVYTQFHLQVDIGKNIRIRTIQSGSFNVISYVFSLHTSNLDEYSQNLEPKPVLICKIHKEIRFKTLAWIHDRSHSNLVKGQQQNQAA